MSRTPLPCPRVPAPRTLDRAGLRAVFGPAPVLHLGQAWRSRTEPRFRPGEIRIGWNRNRLLVLAEMEDSHVGTQADRDQLRLWELGDVFEMFLADVRSPRYVELHVAPNGCRLQLRFPDSRAVTRIRAGTRTLSDYLEPAPHFEGVAERTARGWAVSASIPATALLPHGTPLEGRKWRVSFSRYDASPRSLPVLSSTSPHRILNFHRRRDWLPIRFTAAPQAPGSSGGPAAPSSS